MPDTWDEETAQGGEPPDSETEAPADAAPVEGLTDEGYREADRRPLWFGLLVVVGILAVIAIAVWSSGVLRSESEVSVPDVVGKSLSAARSTVRDSGLDVERVDRAYSTRVSEGTVLAQTPSAGSLVPRGSDLALVVARGVEEGSVPEVLGMDVEAAIKAVEAAGYKVVVEERTDAKAAPGVVLEQEPSEGSPAKGSTVRLIVAVGTTAEVRTPDVVGALQPAAVSILHEAGLKAQSYWVTGSTSREVVNQYPPAGMLTPKGTVVQLSVTAGTDNPSLPTEGIGP